MVVEEADPRLVATSLQTFTETSNLVRNILVLVSMKELVPRIRLDTVFVSGPVPVLATGVLLPRFVDDFLDCFAWGPRYFEYWRSKRTDSGGKSVGYCHLRGTVPPKSALVGCPERLSVAIDDRLVEILSWQRVSNRGGGERRIRRTIHNTKSCICLRT